jgi:hypothetical protein
MTYADQMASALREALTPWVGRSLTVRERVEQRGVQAAVHTGVVEALAAGGVVFRNRHGYAQFFSWPDWIVGLVDPVDPAFAAQIRTIRRATAAPVVPFDSAALLRRLAADPSVAMTRWALEVGVGV